jgi:transcriptional regulator with XRE-family HTH domain
MSETRPLSIGEQLRARRKELHLSQTDIAKKMGVHYRVVHDVESGATDKMLNFHEYARVLGGRIVITLEDFPPAIIKLELSDGTI